MTGRLVDEHLAPLVQIVGFVRKEVVEIVRQPRLIAVLVVGPFLVLALFAAAFDPEQTVLDTTFVGPADSIYEESVESFAAELAQYVDYRGYTTDLVAAQQALTSGEIDLIVVFPVDPAQRVLACEQAVIGVFHDKIDPIQQTSVQVSTQVAVQELNARILEEVVGRTQDVLVPYGESLDRTTAGFADLQDAVERGDEAAVDRQIDELERSTGALSTIVEVSRDLSDALGADGANRSDLDRLATSIDDLRAAVGSLATSPDLDEADVVAAGELLDAVRGDGELVTTLDPGVVVRPFTAETASFQRQGVSVADYFAPAAVALLLQHMLLTFASLSVVADRDHGLFELFRAGPIGAGRVLLGKVGGAASIGVVVAAALLAALWVGLDVPMRGDVGWVVAAVLGLLLSSIGLGVVIALLSRSDTQAVQYALLALLAGLFFSGFFLDLDAFRAPARAFSWTMPVTSATRMLRDVMLRGTPPAAADLVGMITTVIVFLAIAWWLLHRRLRVR